MNCNNIFTRLLALIFYKRSTNLIISESNFISTCDNNIITKVTFAKLENGIFVLEVDVWLFAFSVSIINYESKLFFNVSCML